MREYPQGLSPNRSAQAALQKLPLYRDRTPVRLCFQDCRHAVQAPRATARTSPGRKGGVVLDSSHWGSSLDPAAGLPSNYQITKGGLFMKREVIILMAVAMIGWSSFSVAGDLAFPKTEAEIVKALKLKDGKTTFNGTEYVSEKGNVYKIIGGKRYQLRGLESIVDSDITPKAGALVHFDFDSANIKADSYSLLDEYGKALKGGLSDAVVAVAGHTDSKGADQYNMELSEKRAAAIKDYLVGKHGITPERIVVKAYGKSKPIASNETPDGQALNRRVEFIRLGAL